MGPPAFWTCLSVTGGSSVRAIVDLRGTRIVWNRESAKATCMTIVGSYNIHKAVGTDMRRDPARVVRVIAEMGG